MTWKMNPPKRPPSRRDGFYWGRISFPTPEGVGKIHSIPSGCNQTGHSERQSQEGIDGSESPSLMSKTRIIFQERFSVHNFYPANPDRHLSAAVPLKRNRQLHFQTQLFLLRLDY